MGLCVRGIGLARAIIRIGMVNLVANIKRLVWLDGGAMAPAWRRRPAMRADYPGDKACAAR